MSYILGMDTGGTYTNGVIVDSIAKKVLCKAKSLTTKEDLTIGIKNCLSYLDETYYKKIALVSLSTTLATNAIVENRGCRVGLILFGHMLEGEELPADVCKIIKGEFDIMGRLKEDMDEEQARQAIESMKGKVDAIAISGYASVRNPKHERRAQELVKEILDVPTVYAHQLTTSLGFYHRTVTAILNVRLIPIIAELIAATKKVLQEKNIHAPIMIVKGDGTLMTEEMAKERPIETILSGPAASVIGGCFLTGEKNAMIMDMGGTTTDIALIENGIVKIKKEGASVGGWRTRVQAAEISTFGLGGDSRIYLDTKGNLQIGPKKAMPLCIAGHKYPYLIHELKSFQRWGSFKAYHDQEADCYLLLKQPNESLLTEKERKIVQRLSNGPHSITKLAESIGLDPEVVDLTNLVEEGYLVRISVTPTDILHVQGKYNQWNTDIARAGAEILAKRMEVPLNIFLKKAADMIYAKLALTALQSIANVEEKDFDISENEAAMYLIQQAFSPNPNSFFQSLFTLRQPIIGIGAPAEAWLGGAAEILKSNLIIPEHAEVANAVGAAVGQIMETIEILIHIDTKSNTYILNTPWSREVYKTLQEAEFYAIHEGRKYLQQLFEEIGCDRCDITQKYKENKFVNEAMEVDTFSDAVLILTAVGNIASVVK